MTLLKYLMVSFGTFLFTAVGALVVWNLFLSPYSYQGDALVWTAPGGGPLKIYRVQTDEHRVCHILALEEGVRVPEYLGLDCDS